MIKTYLAFKLFEFCIGIGISIILGVIILFLYLYNENKRADLMKQTSFEFFVEIENEIIKQIKFRFSGITHKQCSHLIVNLIIKCGGWNALSKTVLDYQKAGRSMHDSVQYILNIHQKYINEIVHESGYKIKNIT